MEIKLSPLVLFLGLFIVLALSVYFSNSWIFKNDDATEPFLSLGNSAAPLTQFTLNAYSPTSTQVYKLFDNVFFDRTNANTIEVLGNATVPTTITDGTGSITINTDPSAYMLRIYTPDGTTNQYNPVPRDSSVFSESTISAIPSTYSNFVITDPLPTYTTFNPRFSPGKQIVVVTWNKDSFITVIVKNDAAATPTLGYMAYFPYNVQSQIQQRFYDVTNTSFNAPTSQSPLVLRDFGSSSVSDLNDGKSVAVTNYDSTKKVFQVCKGVLYDITNSNIIFTNADGTIVVYARPTSLGVDPTGATYPDSSSQPAKNTPNSVPSVSYAPWYKITPDNKYLVQYIAWGQMTVVSVLVNRGGYFDMYKTYRFNADGTIDGDGSVVQPSSSTGTASTTGSTGTNTTSNAMDTSGNALSDYYQWLAFWNTVASGSANGAALSSSNLIPKSSVVPPVCPSCPSCQISGNTVCTNCGGQGGSGTQNASGSGSSDSLGKKAVSGTVDLLESAGSGTTQLLKDTGSGAAGLARDTASGTVGLAKETVGGTVGLAKETVGGAVGLAKETVGGAVGLAKDTAGGIAGLFGATNPTQVQGPQGGPAGSNISGGGFGANAGSAYGQPSTIPGVDPYSYFGAIPPKGANYIPMTANFSAFAK